MSTLIVNEQLDILAISFVECYQDILFNRELLNNSLDDAYLNLSKARSLIGCNNLSLLQIPNEIESSLFIDDSHDTFKLFTHDIDLKKNCSWFGLFTPLSLKNSQKSFFKSVEIIINLCNLNSKLKSIENEYKKLLEKKNVLLNLEE
jgi:hypothetical protein